MSTTAITYYDKHHDRAIVPVGGLRIVQVRDHLNIWTLGLCDCGTQDVPCMESAVVLLTDESHKAFLLCEYHNRVCMEQVG